MDGRAVAAWVTTEMHWQTVLSFKSRAAKHRNLLELEAAVALVCRLVRHGHMNLQVDSSVALGALAAGHSSSRRVNYAWKKLRFPLLVNGIALEVVWTPTWAKLADVGKACS